jgi:hypothetical protein
MRRLVTTTLAALALLSVARRTDAQALGPQRQFLAIEPYYERASFDAGVGVARQGTNSYGARLWINLDPFHFIPSGSIALFMSRTPSQGSTTSAFNGVTALHYGAEYDQYLVRRPLGGIIDPFLTVGGGRYRIGAEGSRQSYWTLMPGGGIRIPIPNRLELRGDVKDQMIFRTPSGVAGAKRTTNNLLLQGGVGITF